MEADQFYTISDAARITGLPARKILYRIRKGELKNAQKLGWLWVLSEQDLEDLKKKFTKSEELESKNKKRKRRRRKIPTEK